LNRIEFAQSTSADHYSSMTPLEPNVPNEAAPLLVSMTTYFLSEQSNREKTFRRSFEPLM
jgi:hypothetical protein